MMNEQNLKLPANVILIDVAYLNFMIADIKKYFEHKLNRSLQVIDFALLMEYAAMDANYSIEKNETQVLLAFDNQSTSLFNCQPSDIRNELDGMAFAGDLGEFMFAGVPCENMVSRQELILDLLNITIDSADVKRIIIIGADKEYDSKVIELLNGVTNKEILQYRMDESTDQISYHWELLVFPIMQALGIKEDEI